jgi:hypothetical protein
MSKRVAFFIMALLCLGLFHYVKTDGNHETSIDVNLASQYFEELKNILDKDNGWLWGVNLYGKVLFVDPASRVIVANQQNKLNTFKKEGTVFIGELEKEVNLANTAVDLYGEKWTMVIWDHIPRDNKYDRDWLLAHESWHRIQQDIGLPPMTTDNSHLDKLEGRIYLKLEWRALRKALLSAGSKRVEAIKDALIFRNYRQNIFASARVNESRFEMHEGLANYTGAKLSGYPLDGLLIELERQMKNAEENKSFNWSFAYQTGPAYGILLDELNVSWRSNIKTTSDFGEIIQRAISFQIPKDLKTEAERRYSQYEGEELIKAEQEYEDKQNRILKEYKDIFIEKPNLKIDLIKMNISFNPQEIFPLEEYGNVYRTARIVDEWGILEVGKGLLLDKNWQRVTVSEPQIIEGQEIKGDGWVLKLNESWRVVKNESGNYSLERNKNLVFGCAGRVAGFDSTSPLTIEANCKTR